MRICEDTPLSAVMIRNSKGEREFSLVCSNPEQARVWAGLFVQIVANQTGRFLQASVIDAARDEKPDELPDPMEVVQRLRAKQ